MSRYNKIDIHKISEILDRTAEGGSFQSIAKDTDVNHSTVWNIVQDFPLWAYFREKPRTE